MKHLLNKNEALYCGEALYSINKKFMTVLQNDGNFVIYYCLKNRSLWHTNTFGKNQKLILQDDGNLVLYSNSNKPVWASNTRSGNSLVMQDDGNLVLYSKENKAVWNSGSCKYTFDFYLQQQKPKGMEKILLEKVIENVSQKEISLDFDLQFIDLIKNLHYCFGHFKMDSKKNVSCDMYGKISLQGESFRNILISKINNLKSNIDLQFSFFIEFDDGIDYPENVLEFIKKHVIVLSAYSKIGRENIEILIPDIYMMESQFREAFYKTKNNNIPFNERITIAKFRGSQTGGLYNMEEVAKMQIPRLKAAHLSKEFPQYLDSKIMNTYDCQNNGGQEYIDYMKNTFGEPAKAEPMNKFNNFRYLICFDGNNAPPFARPETIMVSGSVPFFQTEYIKYWSCFLQNNYNYIFIEKDLSNLISSVKEMNSNFEMSKQIAKKAKILAEQVMTPEFQDKYITSVLNLISRFY